MREYYYLTGLKDSPYDLTMADALHLGACCTLNVYAFIEQVALMESRDTGTRVKQAGMYLRILGETLTTIEKGLSKGRQQEVFVRRAILDTRHKAPIGFGNPFAGERRESIAVDLYEDVPEYRFHLLHEVIPVPQIGPEDLLCLVDDLESLVNQGLIKRRADDTGTAASDQPAAEHQDYPPQLRALMVAWRTHWGNADPDDRTTCPKKSDVVDWLIERGFSAKNADAGATIIKPQWARDKGL
ncbi:hypothetical protein [Halomonas sp.]|uniref:hypothetical protein n=1 Tax=Halomonas sp. TaxID=1486246 RepID=UPI0035670206